MKDIVTTIVTYSLLIGGVISGNWFGHPELLRLSIWVTWVIILASGCAVILPAKDFYKNPRTNKKTTWKRLFFFSHLMLLVAAGWMFTATMYFVVWICLWVKRQVWEGEKQKAETNTA